MSPYAKNVLTPQQREEITRRVLAGEQATALGREFGVTRAYVALLKAQALDPERFALKLEAKRTRKLTSDEKQRFLELLATTTPEDHDLVPTLHRWSLDHGQQLAKKLFGKRLSLAALNELVTPFIPKKADFKFGKPQAPKPHHINQIPPELAADPDYVAYYLSPICEQIARREYELALADWEQRFSHEESDATPTPGPAAPEPPAPTRPGLRSGKHAKSKGLPFTRPKKRRKR